jgi:hypothetical protein
MSDEEDNEDLTPSKGESIAGFFGKVLGMPIRLAIGAVGSVILNGVFSFLPSVFSVIVMILKPIFIILYYLLFKIVPFLVTYIGIPLFILGAILAVMFMGGHMLMIIVFIINHA